MIFKIEFLFLILLIFLWFRGYNKKVFFGIITIDFSFFIGMGWIMYSAFVLAEKLIRCDINIYVEQFMLDSVIALFFLVLGSYIGIIFIITRKKISKGIYLSTVREKILFYQGDIEITIILSAIAVILVYLYIKIAFGGFHIYFTQQYGQYIQSGINSLIVTFPFFCVSYILVLNNKSLFYSKIASCIVFIVSLIMIGIFILGGNRNLAGMMIIALMWAKLSGKEIYYYEMIPLLLTAIVCVAIIAVGREYGLINVLSGREYVTKNDIMSYIFAYSEGEFGTMFRMYQYIAEKDPGIALQYGYSYTIGTFVNLIPTMIYSSRPFTLAKAFTVNYWDSSAYGIIGLGFSPIIEAKLNFGAGWFIIFFLCGIMIRLLLGKSYLNSTIFKRDKISWKFFIMGSLSAISFNFFRIDFAVAFKFFIIILFFSILIQFFIIFLHKYLLSKKV